eukprot:4533103-Karenia_brevis.AAC.1
MLVASSPKLLDRAIQLLLHHVVNVFARLALDLNWKKGKSECIIRYRGKHASECYAEHRVDNKLVYVVLAAPGQQSTT